MINFISNKYLKIFLLLAAAYFITDFSINNLFLAKTPKINPFAAQNMLAKVSSIWSKTTSFIAFKDNSSSSVAPTTEPALDNFSNNSGSNKVTFQKGSASKEVLDGLKVPLNKVSQGVYAGERNNIQVYEVKSEEIEYLVYTFNVNGKEIKVKIPKDQKPPSQEVVEALYK